MGGRGASTGVSYGGNRYGTQYRTLLKAGNIKFVTKNTRESEALMETMTKGRVYVTVGGDALLSVTYFDHNNMRVKTTNLDHSHQGQQPHVHHGYLHSENDGAKGATGLNDKERKLVAHVTKLWYTHIGKR